MGKSSEGHPVHRFKDVVSNADTVNLIHRYLF